MVCCFCFFWANQKEALAHQYTVGSHIQCKVVSHTGTRTRARVQRLECELCAALYLINSRLRYTEIQVSPQVQVHACVPNRVTCLSHFSPNDPGLTIVKPDDSICVKHMYVWSLSFRAVSYLEIAAVRGIASGMSSRCTLCHHWRPFTTVQVHLPEATVATSLLTDKSTHPATAPTEITWQPVSSKAAAHQDCVSQHVNCIISHRKSKHHIRNSSGQQT